MGQDPNQIRQNIEGTRADMGATLDEIEDRVSPRRVITRRQQRLRDRWDVVRIRVMGEYEEPTPYQATLSSGGGSNVDQVKDSAQQAKESAKQAPERVRQQTQGNPLVAGAVAFGAGVLAASLLPPTRQEQQAATALQEKAEPLKQQAKQTASEVGSQVADQAKGAKDHLTEQARESADLVKNEAQAQKEDVRGEASARAEDVKREADSSAEEVKGHAQSSAQNVKGNQGS